MLSLKVIDTDLFLNMPLSAQGLYMHLVLRSDDDGFMDKRKKVMAMVKAKKADYELLIQNKYIIDFDTGVCVIRHWFVHNLIAKDRRNDTMYTEEIKQLTLDVNKMYTK
jgi:hypothetical protein